MGESVCTAPRNSVYIVQGELNHVVAALRRSNRWSGGQYHQDEDQDSVLQSFSNLKDVLQSTSDIRDLDTNTFLGPFLDVIRSEDTTGPITGVALSSVNKFLSYGLIDPLCESASSGIENLADAVTHARFVGTDPSSDEVVLMKILQVLRTLLLSPVGVHMTNDSVCEIMQSCFRICFEMRLSELLRRTAEQTLNDMVQLLFSRLPQFKGDIKSTGSAPHIRKMFTRAGPLARTRRASKKPSPKPRRSSHQSEKNHSKRSAATHTTTESTEVSKSGKTTGEETNPENAIGSSDLSRESCDVVVVEKDDVISNDQLVEDSDKAQKSESRVDTVEEEPDGISEDSSTMCSNDTAAEDNVPPAISVTEDVKEDSAELSSPETPRKENVGELEAKFSDMESCEGLNNKELTEGLSPDMSGLKSHGIISLQYPDDDVRSVEEDTVNPEREKDESNTDFDEKVDDSKREEYPHPQDTSSIVGDSSHSADESEHDSQSDYINPQGVRFTVQENAKEGHGPLIPYGLPCVRELLRFLITLINPHDRHNTNTMIHIGLSLLTVALESGAHNLGHYQPLMNLVKDELTKNLFALLHCDIHVLFSLSMRVCFMLFEALRGYLKYQLEMLFMKLMDILSLEHISVPYEKREMALEYINQLFHIPFLVTELYLNYDCDLACSNVLEDLCKVLSKNAFRPGNLSSVNMLALDALLTIVTEIESHCRHGGNSETTQQDKPKVEIREERGISTSSERTGEDESGSEDGLEYPDVCHPILPTSGFAVAKKLMQSTSDHQRKRLNPKLRTFSETSEIVLPGLEELRKQKHRKKMLWQGIEEFNKKPKKGIEFLQEHNLLSNPLDADELVHFFKEYQRVDKKTIGDYVGDRRNGKVLESFVKSFDLKGIRLDEALRMFLESFRLPGESPVISLILEQFSENYYQNNKTPYANTDAAFTLSYATIMLNVDQHNANVKQQKSMTLEEFKKNLRKVNGGVDFPAELLEDIYHAIKNEEIVMPSERTGRVKENFEWKMLLKKGIRSEFQFTHANTNAYEEDLFLLVWGPTVAALSYVYDNGMDKATVQKAINGFRKCATISAHYALSEVFDNLVISLCKFTTLLSQGEPSDNLAITFGTNMKAQHSARTAFALAHKHGEILREGWQNLLVCLFQLFKAKLLPKVLTEVEDFVDQSGKISLLREEPPPVTRPDSSGILSSFYLYILSNPDTTSNRGQSAEDRQAQEQALSCIKDCHPELLISESKFLRAESLQELVKALVISSKPESALEANDVPFDEESAAFFLEFLVQVALQNRDRITLLWQTLRDHISAIIIGAPRASFLVERAVVGLLRLAIRLLRREEISPQVLISLRIIFMMKPKVLHSCCRQISFGLHELIRTNVTNITMSRDWITIFTLLEVVGAGGKAPLVKPGPSLTMVAGEDNVEEEVEEETGETYRPVKAENADGEKQNVSQQEGQMGEAWLLINREDQSGKPVNQYDLAFGETMSKHDSRSFIKACGTLGLIIRDGAHVCRQNIFQCIHALLLYAEVSSNGSVKYRIEDPLFQVEKDERIQQSVKGSKKSRRKLHSPKGSRKKGNSPLTNNALSEDEQEINESTGNIYDAISLQLLDLMYSVHTNAAKILGNLGWEEFQESQKAEVRTRWSSRDSIDQLPSTYKGDISGEMSLLWVKCWCPLLQGIARLCCDNRREIRMSALTVLQRALLAQDLQSLTATEWESCFNKVLFPMLAKLLEIYTEVDPLGLEETRMRAATLLCKAFLQRLNTLLSLSTFTALWMTILDFMDRYMHADNSDLLLEAIPESLKNMLLVMSTAGIFDNEGGGSDVTMETLKTSEQGKEANRQYSALWQITWERIDCFLPNLRQDLIATKSPMASRASSPPMPPEPQTMEIEGRPLSDDESSKCASETNMVPNLPVSLSTVSSPGNISLSPSTEMSIVLQPPLPALNSTGDIKIPSPSSPPGMPILLAPKPLPRSQSPAKPELNKDTSNDQSEMDAMANSECDGEANASDPVNIVYEI